MDLVGPVAWYDLLRVSRRARLFILRFAFCLTVFFVVLICYLAFAERVRARAAGGAVVGGIFYSSGLERGDVSQALMREAARFGQQVFFLFCLLGFAVILLATPTIVAGALAEEKQRQTLEYLLATDLSSGEIVGGKLVARLFVLVCLVLGAVPIIALTQWVGGIEMALLFLVLAAFVATIYSLAGLSLWCAVKARRLRGALVGAYLILFLLFAAWILPVYMVAKCARLDPALRQGLEFVVGAMNVVNPLAALTYLENYFALRGQLGAEAARVCLGYCSVHFLLGTLLLLGATRQLRSAYQRQQMETVRLARRLARRPRPKLWPDAPLLWKELTGVGGPRIGRWGWAAIVLLTTCWLGGDLWTLACYFFSEGYCPPNSWDAYQFRFGAGRGSAAQRSFYEAYLRLIEELHWFVLIPFGLSLLLAALRGAGAIAQEREQQTWDGLIGAPVTLKAILRAKLLGAVGSARGPILYSLGIIALSVAIGVLNAAAGLMVSALLPLNVSFAAVLGLFFSLFAATAQRATLGTLMILSLVCLAPLVALELLNRALSGVTTMGEIVLAVLDAAEWTWLLAILAVISVVIAKFSPPRVRAPLWFAVKTFMIGTPVLFVALLMVFAIAETLDLRISMGAIFALQSPLWTPYAIWKSSFYAYAGDRSVSMFFAALLLYAPATAALWFVTRWRLRKNSGRVDGTRPRKRPPVSAGQAVVAGFSLREGLERRPEPSGTNAH